DAEAPASGLRAVHVHDTYVDAAGFVPEAALGGGWGAGEREDYKQVEDAPSATGATAKAGPGRAGASDGGPGIAAVNTRAPAPVIATIKPDGPARVVAKHGAWTEIEVHVPRVRVHGFVAASAIDGNDNFGLIGVGGSGYGISDTSRLDVPVGACLYGGANGEV